MDTVGQVIDQAKSILAGHVERPDTDAQVLANFVLGTNRAWVIVHRDKPFPVHQLSCYRQLIKRRLNGEPVAYLVGCREFWSLALKTTPDTLIARPETETLVEQALLLPIPKKATVLDFGTGSGAIILALAKERPNWSCHALEQSIAALEVAKENAMYHRLERIDFQIGHTLTSYHRHQFDLLVSNPPYIAQNDPHLFQGDVRYEPYTALVSGEEGLCCIGYLIGAAPQCVKPGGYILLEHGHEQGPAVREKLTQAGYLDIQTSCDLAGHERVTRAKCP